MSHVSPECLCDNKTREVSAVIDRLRPPHVAPTLHMVRTALEAAGAKLPPRHGQPEICFSTLAVMVGNWNYRTLIKDHLSTPEGKALVEKIGFCEACRRELYRPRPMEQVATENDRRAEGHIRAVLESNEDVEQVLAVDLKRVTVSRCRGACKHSSDGKKTVRQFCARLLLRDGQAITTPWWQYQGRNQLVRLLASRHFLDRPQQYDTGPMKDEAGRHAFESEFCREFAVKHDIPEEYLRVQVLTSGCVSPVERPLYRERYRARDLCPVEVSLVVPHRSGTDRDPHVVDVAHLTRRQLREGKDNPFSFASGVQRDFLKVQMSRVPSVQSFERCWELDGKGKLRPKLGFVSDGDEFHGYRWTLCPSTTPPLELSRRAPLALRERNAGDKPRRAFISLLRVEFELDGYVCLKISYAREIQLETELPPEYAVLAAIGTSYRMEAVSYERFLRGHDINPGQYRVSILQSVCADEATARTIDRTVKASTRHLRDIPPAILSAKQDARNGTMVRPPRGFTELRIFGSEDACRLALAEAAGEHGLAPFEPAASGLPWAKLVGPRDARVSPNEWVLDLWKTRAHRGLA